MRTNKVAEAPLIAEANKYTQKTFIINIDKI